MYSPAMGVCSFFLRLLHAHIRFAAHIELLQLLLPLPVHVLRHAQAFSAFYEELLKHLFAQINAIYPPNHFTVTLQLAFTLLPSAALQVMIQLPFPFALTLPLDETVATFLLLEDHLTFCFAAPAGRISFTLIV